MKKKLIESMLLVALVCVLLSLGFVLPRLYWSFAERTSAELRDMAVGLAAIADGAENRPETLARLHADLPNLRLSWIDSTGKVLYDSGVSQSDTLENHADREEFKEALESGAGSGSRLSASLGERTYYYAHKLSDGSVLRLAKTERSVWAELAGLIPWLLLIAVLAIGLSIVLAGLLTKYLMAPILRLDLDHPEENVVYDELTPLLERISKQNKRIEEQLRAHRETLQITTTITENMAEGLLMLAPDGRIVSINHSAARLLGSTPEAFQGHHYLLACRDLDFHRHIEQALQKKRAESKIILHGRIFQVLAEPICEDSDLDGVIILLLDITEHEQAEMTRREFSANVSHELKTPLTTIAGYAEMMQTGLSNAEDTAELSGKILGESRRLLALIEDIIKLSRLDEQTGELERVPVPLLRLAASVVDRAQPAAAERGLTLGCTGTEQMVLGSPMLLEEILRNLVDNAVRYNVAGGSVQVEIGEDAESTLICVSDTGVGIAPEHRARIFERFYRVDKSHSRETGGTGLGLSIVKHGVQNLGGTVALSSEPGVGTEVTIAFPKQQS